MDLDKFETQIRQLKEKENSYFYLDDSFGSVRFNWDSANYHYQIVHAVGLITFFDDYSVSQDGTCLSFYRWRECDGKYIQCVCAMIVLRDKDDEHVVADLVERVSE